MPADAPVEDAVKVNRAEQAYKNLRASGSLDLYKGKYVLFMDDTFVGYNKLLIKLVRKIPRISINHVYIAKVE